MYSESHPNDASDPARKHIACVYDNGAAVFVESTVRDLARHALALGVEVTGVDIGRIKVPRSTVSLVYVLPFDSPPGCDRLAELAEAFPSAAIANSPAAHELTTDRVALGERLLERGIPIPESLVTDSPVEAREFIGECQHAVLRDVRAGRRGGGLVVVMTGDGMVAGEIRGRRYVVEFGDDVADIRLAHGVLSHPPPYFLQRLVTRVGRHGVLNPAPVQRAFVIDEVIPFWIESYRDRASRPSDYLVAAETGARRRFLQVVSDEAEKLVRRVAKVVGSTTCAVDIVRSDSGYVVLDVVTDGRNMIIDRSFKQLPEYRGAFDLDRHIAAALVERCR